MLVTEQELKELEDIVFGDTLPVQADRFFSALLLYQFYAMIL